MRTALEQRCSCLIMCQVSLGATVKLLLSYQEVLDSNPGNRLSDYRLRVHTSTLPSRSDPTRCEGRPITVDYAATNSSLFPIVQARFQEESVYISDPYLLHLLFEPLLYGHRSLL